MGMSLEEIGQLNNLQLDMAIAVARGQRWHDRLRYSDDWVCADILRQDAQDLLFSKRIRFLENLQIVASHEVLQPLQRIAWPDVWFFIRPRQIAEAWLLTHEQGVFTAPFKQN